MKKNLTIKLAWPRGFCAGVDRAILIVEKTLEKYGAPVYVRHEIVHNKFVVQSLAKKGAVFVEELDEVPDNVPVIFSAHGIAKSVLLEAQRRNLFYMDASCPLVTKVHREALHFYKEGYSIILIGHNNHPEVIGTMGQLPCGAITLVETIEDVEKLTLSQEQELAYVTQTTLSVDDTQEIINTLQKKYPAIKGPKKEDMCYATTNRQMAVKEIAPLVERMIVIGAPNSSNSSRLVEVAKAYGCAETRLYQRAENIDWDWINGGASLGLTAGASAPEILVEEVIQECKKRYKITLEDVIVAEENIHFNLPRELRS